MTIRKRIHSEEEMYMKHYEAPEMEIILLNNEDVITDSSITTEEV